MGNNKHLKNNMIKTFASFAIAAVAAATCDVAFKSMGKWKMKNPAFPSLTSFADSDPFLLVSSFTGSPIGNGSIWITPGVKDAVTNNTVSKLKAQKIKNIGNFEWPNDIKVIPADVFGDKSRTIMVPDGFLVPGKSNGGLYVITMDANDVTKATKR